LCNRGAAGLNYQEIIWMLHYAEPHLRSAKQSLVALLKVTELDYETDTTL
jgi:hypothetical protein